MVNLLIWRRNSILMTKKSFFFLLFLLVAFGLFAQEKSYSFNKNCKNAYTQIINLQLDSADFFIKTEKQNNPNNLIPVLLEHYRDFLSIVLTEDQEKFKQLKNRKKERLELWEHGDKESPWYLAGQAQIKLQLAFSRVLFDEYFTAATEINSAYHTLEENKKLFPDFYCDNMGLGVLHAMIGVFPDEYQWALEMLGFYGTINQGIEEIQLQLSQDHQAYASEALFYYTFLRLNLQNDSLRFQELLNYYDKEPFLSLTEKSPLLHFSKAVVLLKINTNKAIEVLKNTPNNATALPFHYTDFLLGQALLWRLDDEAPIFLEKYIEEYPGANYKKTAMQRLAWWHFTQNDTIAYQQKMNKTLSIGTTIFDADKVAQKEAEATQNGDLPNLFLLRSRLQFDGHYYIGALNELLKLNISESDDEVRLEYHYRKARIYHQMDSLHLAKNEYKEVLSLGKNSKRYYPGKAALKLGEIAELQMNKEDAIYYYQKCLDLDFTEYRKGIRSKAKAGLQRTNNE